MAKLILGKVLRKRRISKREFARRIKIDQRNVWKLFKAEIDPKFSTLAKWAKALGVRIRDLFEE